MIDTQIRITVHSRNGDVKESVTSNVLTNAGIVALSAKGLSSTIMLGTSRQDVNSSVNTLSAFNKKHSGKWTRPKNNVYNVNTQTIDNQFILVVNFPEEVENVTYTELGIESSALNNITATYALTKDILGNLSSITVLAGEFIRVEYIINQTTNYNVVKDNLGIITYKTPNLWGLSEVMSSNEVYLIPKVEEAVFTGSLPTNSVFIKGANAVKTGNKLKVTFPPDSLAEHTSFEGVFIAGNGLNIASMLLYDQHIIRVAEPKKSLYLETNYIFEGEL